MFTAFITVKILSFDTCQRLSNYILYVSEVHCMAVQYSNKSISKSSPNQKKKKEGAKRDWYLGLQLKFSYRNRESGTERIFKHIFGKNNFSA